MTDEGDEEWIDSVTMPRALAYGLVGELLTASLLASIRVECGLRGRDLRYVRGKREATWNRHIGDQTFNAGIVLVAVSGVPSLALFALAGSLFGDSMPFWVETIAALPASLGIAGLALTYIWRRRRRAWTRVEVTISLEDAARARPAWFLGGVLVAVALISLLRII